MSDNAKDEGVDQLVGLTRHISQIRRRPNFLIAGPIDRSLNLISKRVFCKKKGGAIDLVIDSPGGDASAAYILVRQIRSKYEKLDVLVPRYAKSAATLICLGADSLILGELGELGPLDAQILDTVDGEGARRRSALDRFKALEYIQQYMLDSIHVGVLGMRGSNMRTSELADKASRFAADVSAPLLSQIKPEKIGAAARSLEIGKEYAVRLLQRYSPLSDDDEISRLAEQLVYGYPDHGFVLDQKELSEIGLRVSYAQGELAGSLDTLAEHIELGDRGICHFTDYEQDISPDEKSKEKGNSSSDTEVKLGEQGVVPAVESIEEPNQLAPQGDQA